MTDEPTTGSITLNGVTKAYDDTVVLKGIDLAIRPGEFLVLVGPSGCGKSTLLRCIAGLEDITEGELVIDGTVANEVHPKDRDLAMVFQSYALYPHMDVFENLAFSLTVRKMDRAEIDERVREVAGRLGLSHLLDRRAKQLSGGQRQRVAVGRAIVRQPKAFLFDEPLSNLDAALRGKMRIELKRLHQELGRTMIYVTHDQIEAMTLADRIVVLEGGHVQQVGPPTELFARPANKFVAGFIGSPPMNFLAGTFDPAAPQATGVGFELALPETHRGLAGRPVAATIGVRPTDLVLDDDQPGQCRATVDVVEPLGWESYVHVLIGDTQAVAQIPTSQARHLSPGDEVQLGVDPEAVHLFDADSGEALRPAGDDAAARDGAVAV